MRSISITRKHVAAIACAALSVSGAVAGENPANKLGDIDPACKDPFKTEYETKNLPAKFEEFVPFLHGDERLLMVVCTTVPERPGIRFLLAAKAPMKTGSISILIRQPDHSIFLEAINHTLVQVDGVEGSGASGGFLGIESDRPGVFTVNNSAGDSVQLFNYEFKFRYSPAEKTWLLDSIVTKVFTRDIDLEHE
jgi:hypothetical protein